MLAPRHLSCYFQEIAQVREAALIAVDEFDCLIGRDHVSYVFLGTWRKTIKSLEGAVLMISGVVFLASCMHAGINALAHLMARKSHDW